MRRFSCKSIVLAFILPLLASAAYSQTNPDPKLIEGARSEGEVVYYTSMSTNQVKEMMDLFHKKYPFIQPTFFRSGGGRLLNRIIAEANSGRHQWDVLQGSGDVVAAVKGKGLIAPYLSQEREMFPSDLKDDNGYWTSTYVNPIVLGYNTQLVAKEQVPNTYEELLDPRWKGQKISIDDDYTQLLHGLISAWGKEKALNYFKRLAEQEPVVMGGTTARVQLLIAGEFPLIIAYANILENFAGKGAPINWVPLEPAIITVNSLMLSSHVRHPNAARLLIDFLLSKESQQKLWDFQRIPSREDVEPKPPKLFRGYRRFVVKPEDLEKNFNETITLYGQILGTR